MTRVLIADPDPPSARLLRATLSAEAYDIELATTGAEALQKISVAVPSVLLVELALPDLVGLDLVAGLKAGPLTRDIVVIVVTGRNGHEAEAAAKRAGASGYVRKPIDPIVFPELVRSLLLHR